MLVKREILTVKLLKRYLPGKCHLNRLAGGRFQPRLAKYFTENKTKNKRKKKNSNTSDIHVSQIQQKRTS